MNLIKEVILFSILLLTIISLSLKLPSLVYAESICEQQPTVSTCGQYRSCTWEEGECKPNQNYATLCTPQKIGECQSYRTPHQCVPTIDGGTCVPIAPSTGGTGVFSENISDFNRTIGLNPELGTIGGIISAILPWLLTIAGLILFLTIISGGFALMTAGNNPDNAEKGKQRLTAGAIGFMVIFASYWIIQIMEIILGINILGGA